MLAARQRASSDLDGGLRKCCCTAFGGWTLAFQDLALEDRFALYSLNAHVRHVRRAVLTLLAVSVAEWALVAAAADYDDGRNAMRLGAILILVGCLPLTSRLRLATQLFFHEWGLGVTFFLG